MNWEVDLVVNLLNILQKESVTVEFDKVTWERVADANFSVRNA